MDVMLLQIFVGLVLAAGSVVMFVHSVRARDHEHVDRLSLAPLEEDEVHTGASPSSSEEKA